MSKSEKKAYRTSFTKVCKEFETALQNNDEEQIELQFMLLSDQWVSLDKINAKYVEVLQEGENASENDILNAISTHLEYKSKYFQAKIAYGKHVNQLNVAQSRAVANMSVGVTSQAPYKLPTLSIQKFDGTIGGWLQFWSHFKQFHEDATLPKDNKFQYLRMAMEKGSRAEAIVNSFPMSEDNYDKAVESLRNRFGRQDILVEFYVRELLSLVLQNAMNKGKKFNLSFVYDKISAHIRALESLGVTTDNCATMLYPLVESSLPEETLRTWQRSLGDQERRSNEEPTSNRLEMLLLFLRAEVENEERITMAVQGFSLQAGMEKREKWVSKEKPDVGKEIPTASALVSVENKILSCVFCSNQGHSSVQCFKAKNMSLEERKRIVSKNKLCFKCIKPFHKADKCKSNLNCAWCHKHHSLLMCPFVDKGNHSKESSSFKPQKEICEVAQNLSAFCDTPEVYLQILTVIVYNGSREKVVRALLDSGSMKSYIRADLAKELGYKANGTQEVIHSLFGGISSKNEVHSRFLVFVKDLEKSFACTFNVLEQKVICADIPSVKKSAWCSELKNMNIVLSDQCSKDTEISLLIGADVLGKLYTGNKHDLRNGLTVLETKLGWTVMGKIKQDLQQDAVSKSHSMLVQEGKIPDLWSLDTLGIKDPVEVENKRVQDEIFKENFVKTAFLNSNKRYVVDLPWKENHVPVSTNVGLARKRLDKVVSKLKHNKQFEVYDRVFIEWLKNDIIEVVTNNELNDFGHYLPHRPVFKTEGTTKTRPVFDASAHEAGWPSLNQCLETGPNQIELIPTTIYRWRENEIAVVADVEKAFLQIEINKNFRNYLRFYWYLDGKLTVFRHLRLVFGLTCSPFILAVVFELHFRNILKGITEGRSNWSIEILEKLKESFYVDNCATSVRNSEELTDFMKQSSEIMREGGFELRGWEHTRDKSEKQKVVVLGLLFDKSKDSFSINPHHLNHPIPDKITKRVILSAANRVFDPVGFTCPVTLLPKVLLKKLWKLKTSWDDPVSEQVEKEFLLWYKQLNLLTSIEIPRKLGRKSLSLHVFCDASATAYATVVFLRAEENNQIVLKFVCAKSRLAPDNKTIPRLELLAALLGSRLVSEAIKTLKYRDIPTYYWSDSSTVLAWIKRDLQWGVFVWNRVQEIREKTSGGKWCFVPGEKNPADLPSRGCTAKNLIDSRWWEGPDWLREKQEDWPPNDYETNEEEIKYELKKTSLCTLSCVKDFKLCEKFSSYHKLIRFFAIMLRFKNFKIKKQIYTGNKLTFKEILEAEIKVIRELQKAMFPSKNDPKLAIFETYYDENLILRIKTKIMERDDNLSFLKPILLDGKHEIVKLIIRETHERLCHAGVQIVLHNLREKYWILSARKAIKSVIFNCIICKRYTVKQMVAEPAILPIHRVKDAYVFEVVGVDFTGPLFLKGRQKAWICLYTCAVYRAVHLELVTSMNTSEFLGTLRRFIARRGRPNIIYSDNGTNFVGADNAFNELNWDAIAKYSNARQINWKFNPPTAAWWGGWWERLIGMLKNILRRVLGKASLSYEEMTTILCDCEATLNSRPLTYVSEDPKDLLPLTPAMFLMEVGDYETADLDKVNEIDLNARLRYRQTVMEHLRKRFRKEYLSQLVLKTGKKELRKLKIGDVVLIGDDSRKRFDWPLACVERIINGRDGNPRVVNLKTQKGTLTRPIQRIYPLEIAPDNNLEYIDLRSKAKEKSDKNIQLSNKSENNLNDDKPLLKEYKTRSGRVVKKKRIISVISL